MTRISRRGFTIIEMLLVVCMIGILSAVAMPKIAILRGSVRAATVKGNLSTMRSVLALYYTENDGRYPVDDLNCMRGHNRYFAHAQLPWLMVPDSPGMSISHPRMNYVATPIGLVWVPLDLGSWGYQNRPLGVLTSLGTIVNWGYVLVDCTHRDPKGNFWILY